MFSDPARSEPTIRVLVADNSRIHTRLLVDALETDPHLKAIAFESPSCDLVSTVIAEHIDVLVISSNLDEQPSRSFELLHELRTLHRKTRSVLLLSSSKDDLVLKAFRAGARGLFSKNDPLEQLSECVRSVHMGQVWANNYSLGVAVEALANAPAVRAMNAGGIQLLTTRELRVVQSVAEGLTNREIAAQLRLSQHTVKNYLFRIFDKLGVSSRTELLFMALNHDAGEHSSTKSLPTGSATGAGYSSSESELLEKSAQAGIPAAQLALAQLYLNRRRDPQDLVQAYMWYLVATERAVRARGFITNLMTPEQIDEAQRRAKDWAPKLKRAKRASADA